MTLFERANYGIVSIIMPEWLMWVVIAMWLASVAISFAMIVKNRG